jgi:hypothetical protein
MQIDGKEGELKMDKERNPIDCKHFNKPQCSKRKALWRFENLTTEMVGGVMINRQPVVEEARRICGECKSFEPRERR